MICIDFERLTNARTQNEILHLKRICNYNLQQFINIIIICHPFHKSGTFFFIMFNFVCANEFLTTCYF